MSQKPKRRSATTSSSQKRFGRLLRLETSQKRAFRSVLSRSLIVESLENRHLLASVTDPLLDRITDHVNTSSGRNGIAIVNLTTGESDVINGNGVFGTSSTIKLGVLYTLLRKIDADPALTLDTTINVGPVYGTTAGRGNLTANSTHSLRELSEFMIDTSDNWATNRLMDFVEGRYNFGTQSPGAPGLFPIANQAFDDLGLTSTRLDRYNTGTNASPHGSSGPPSDYRSGHDNETTPNEFVSLLKQIHLNDGLLSVSSYNAFWEIAGLNDGGFRESALIGSYYNKSILTDNSSDGWETILDIYSKPGSNTWTGDVGDFLDDPTIGDHFQRSEAGRILLQNGEVVFYGMFFDEVLDEGDAIVAGGCVGYELASEYSDAPATHTPPSCRLDDGRVVTVRGEGKSVVLKSIDNEDLEIEIANELVATIPFNEIDELRFDGVPSTIEIVGSVNSDTISLDGDFAGGTATAVFAGMVVPLASSSYTLNGGDEDDLIEVDFSFGNPVPPGGLFVGGGDGSDKLRINASDQNVAIASDGTIWIGGKDLHVSDDVEEIILVNARELTAEGTTGDDIFQLGRNIGGDIQLFLNGMLITSLNYQQIDINGLAGSDILSVDSSNGLINVSQGIRYDGGGGVDALLLSQSEGSQTSETLHIGQTPGDGRSVIVGPEGTQIVRFENLEPVATNVPVATFEITSLPGLSSLLQDNNEINYEPSSTFGPTWGRVTVDNFELIDFTNKTNLVIDAGAGSDQISLNNPNTPTSLTSITVNGGDPTAGSDRVIVAGRAGVNDNVTIDQLTIDGARIAGLGPVITVATTEHLFFSGQIGGDQLTIVGAVNRDDDFVHTPGAQIDAGEVAVNSLLPVNYQNLGEDGRVILNGLGAADFDSVVVDGTVSDDSFDVTEQTQSVTLRTPSATHIPIFNRNIRSLTLNGLGGSDQTSILLESVAGNRLSFIDVIGGDGSDNSLTVLSESNVDETFAIRQNSLNGSGQIRIQNAPRTLAIAYSSLTYLSVFANDADDDDLVVEDGFHDNSQWVVDGGFTPADLIKIDDRESIEFDGFRNVELVNNFGTDTFSIYPTHLIGYSGTLKVTGDTPPPGSIDDVLKLLGTEVTDVVSSNADTLTFNGKRVQIGENIAVLQIDTLGGNDTIDLDLQVVGLAKFIYAGAGNDIVNLLGVAVDPADPTIYGGDGDDTIIGSPNPDFIFGGTGNDILVGAGGVDQIYGEEGNDVLGNPSAVANGVADDAGNDFFHGGTGSDTVIWEPGDGSDIIEGGAGDADVLAFFGGAGVEVFNVFAKLSDPSRAILFRNTGNITIDMAGVDQINVQGNAGADAYVVGRANNGDSGSAVAPTSPYVDPTASLSDLSTTEVRVVNIFEAIDAPDNVFIDGRPTDDNMTVSVESAATGILRVAGLPYDVRISGSNTADRLTIRGNEGKDTIKSINSSSATVEGLIGITFAGGAGNDTLSADAILIGGSGDDFLEGGAGIDQLFGNDGEDTMVGGAAADTFDGGAGFDTILVRGTSGEDIINVIQSSETTLTYTVNGIAETDTLITVAGVRTVEQVRVEAGEGADLIKTRLFDGLGVDAALNSLRMTVVGGDDTAQDRLIVVEDGTDDLLIYRKSQDDSAGTTTIGPGNAEPLLTVFSGIERVQFTDESGAALNPSAATGPQLVVFKHDPFELNDDRFVATHLGANETVNVDPTIDPGALVNPFGDGQDVPGDHDFYRIVADVNGILDFQVYFRQIGTLASGRPGLPTSGNLDVNVRDAAGNIIAGFGANDATSDERMRIPAVAGQTYYLEVFGNATAINVYSLTITNRVPPTPRDMELLDNPVGDPPAANSDTGRSQFDNVTRDNTPTLVFRLDDGILLNDIQGNSPAGNNPPNGVVIPIPFQAAAGTAGYRIAIFDEGSSPAPGTQAGTAPQTPLGFATFVSPGVYQFTTPVLTDGSHFLTARVQMVDPATPQQTGFGDRSVALEVVVDTVIPASFFGQTSLADTTQGLDAASDSGVAGDSATFVDRVTNGTTPGFYGRAEANAIVRVYAETNGVAGLQSTGAGADLFLGLTTASPLDGTNQFPGGQWSFTTPLDLNNPSLGFAHDGARGIYMTSEDLAGNVTTDATADRLNIFLDTEGPQVSDVRITGSPQFNLFGLKPNNSVEGPTPRVDSLTISVQDFPNRSNVDPNFLYAALQKAVAEAPGNFVLKGDHSGIISIQSITFIGDPTGNAALATGSILLNFFAPLPDDRYTLTVKESVVDPVGNKLDGESNAAEPIGNPAFASGDGQPGGDFVARFTVDSRPEIGAISEGLVYVDINGNMVWDPEGQNNDATNRDFTFQFGQLVDAHFSGNFAPTGAAAASGYDKLGAYGKFAGKYSFILDTNDDGVGDFSSLMPAAYQVNGNPVVGDFSAAHPGDEIGLFDGTFWYLDTNGNNQIDLGERFASNFNGLPVVGDFNGDGNDDLAVFVNDTNRFIFDTNRDGNADFTWNVADQLGRFGGLSGFTDRPVAGDLNLDGIDDIGLWAKDRQGTLPRNSGEYFFWVSDRASANPANVFDSFSPAPIGNDLSAQFGDELALPVFGNFDPPVTTSTVDSNPLHRAPAPLDINGDGVVSPIDALLVINVLNNFQGLPANDPVRAYFTIGQVKADASGDRGVTPLDALLVINALNRKSTVGGEGEGETLDASTGAEQYQMAADDFFGQLGDTSDLESLKKRRL